MPPTSEKQRRAMRAAASGSSTIGIPKSVGAEFSEADPGGKLPQRKKKKGKWAARSASGGQFNLKKEGKKP